MTRMHCTSVAFCAGSIASVAAGQCEPAWEAPGTLSGGAAGLAVFDEGTGENLFAGGGMDVTPETPETGGIGRWDGAAWTGLGGELTPIGTETVRVLAVFDDGSGAALYAGGALTSAGGQPASRIARWDGESWSALGDGLDNNARAIVGFDEDGDGPNAPVLMVGGTFLNAGGAAARNIARWDGESWSPVGSGVDNDGGAIRSALVWDDGTGAALYVTGTFTSIGGVAANNIAKWDGEAWSALGEGITGGVGAPGVSMALWNDGGGQALYVGGELTTAGGQAASLCAKWDGEAWSPLAEGIAGTRVRAVAAFDDGSGSALYCGGEFAGGTITRWDGAAWGPVGTGTDGYILSLLPAIRPQFGLYAGGQFTMAGGNPAGNIALWTGCDADDCYADWTGDGLLDLFDFLGYVNSFNAGEDAADCVSDGALDLFDFLCFVNAFNAGC